MKHGKTDQTAVRRFLFDNAEQLILGTLFAVGLLLGLLGLFGQAGADVVSREQGSFLRLFFQSFLPVALFFFASFFCGTSPFGVISPLLLLLYGFSCGAGIRLLLQTDPYYHYLLFCFPPLLFSAVILIEQTRCGISLSLRLFQLCTGGGAADLSVRFRLFLRRCLIGILLAAAVALLFSFLRFTFSS